MRGGDLTGCRFGKLVVLRKGAGQVYGETLRKRRSTWICKCDCGNEVEVVRNNLKRTGKPNTTSCGCKIKTSKKYNSVDLLGRKFGLLSVVKKSEKMTKTRGALWICNCNCGATVELSTNALLAHNNRTCGDKTKHFKASKYVGEIPMAHLHLTKWNALKRDISFKISDEYVWDLFLQQKRKCALSGVELTFVKGKNAWKNRSIGTNASLDRIDSNLGYIVGNVQWVHKDINKMKMSYDNRNFILMCKTIYLYHLETDSETFYYKI